MNIMLRGRRARTPGNLGAQVQPCQIFRERMAGRSRVIGFSSSPRIRA